MKVFGIILSTLLLTTQMLAQCITENEHPKGRDYALSMSVYQDFVKAKDYAGALPKWSDLYDNCPAAFKGKVLNDGEKIYKGLAKAEKDAAKKKEYNLKLAEIMQKRIECYGSKIRKKSGLAYTGYRYYSLAKLYTTQLKDYEKAREAFEKSIEADGNKVEAGVVSLYAYVAVRLFKAEKLTVKEAREIHSKLSKIAESDFSKFEEAKEKFDKEFRKIERDIFDCEYFLDRIKPDFYSNYTNIDYLKEEIFLALRRAECGSDEPFVVQVEERINFLKDSIDDARKDLIDRGFDAYRANDIPLAKDYLSQGINSATIETSKKAKGAMLLGKLQQKDKEWSSSLATYKKAAELNPSSGEPYISIGLLYLTANKSCSGFERQLVAGAALDQFRKAKNFSDTAGAATDKVSTYRAYLPTKEVLFQRGMKPDAGRTVGCVLKASTTVQSKD